MIDVIYSAADFYIADGPGEAIGGWLKDQAAGLFIGIVAILAVGFLWKRQVVELGTFLIVTLVVALLIFSGNIFKDQISAWWSSIF